MSTARYFTFIHTSVYAAAAKDLLTDDEQRAIEAMILENPDRGAVIPGAGVRKLRVALPGRGKRGGARVIYFVVKQKSRVYLLDVFAKSERTDITPRQRHELAELRRIFEEEE